MFYPTPNQTTIGVGEVSDIVLRPHAVTNITFPMQLFSSTFESIDKNTTLEAPDNKNPILKSIASQLCSAETDDNAGEAKEIDIVYDLMPTFKFGEYGALSLSFTGQTAKISCEKVCVRPVVAYAFLIVYQLVAKYGQRILISKRFSYLLCYLSCIRCQRNKLSLVKYMIMEEHFENKTVNLSIKLQDIREHTTARHVFAVVFIFL